MHLDTTATLTNRLIKHTHATTTTHTPPLLTCMRRAVGVLVRCPTRRVAPPATPTLSSSHTHHARAPTQPLLRHLQVVHATVIPDDRSMLTGALKLAPACPAAAAALSRELEAYARLADQRDIPRVLAWAPTTDGTAVAAILFDRLPGTLADDIALRLRVLATTNPERPHPTRDAPLYSPHEYWPVIHKLAALLAVAHGRGIIHADIKPANILLDTDRNPKLADWGIFLDAPVDGAPPPTVRGPHGTEGYCLPALAAGAETVEVNFSIDTQALALTVVEMLLGMLPEHAREVAGQGELGEYLPPHDGELRSLVLGTLREEAGERPPVAAWLRGRRRGCCVPEPRIWGAVEVPLGAPRTRAVAHACVCTCARMNRHPCLLRHWWRMQPKTCCR